MENCMKFGQLILSKIIKIVATSWKTEGEEGVVTGEGERRRGEGGRGS